MRRVSLRAACLAGAGLAATAAIARSDAGTGWTTPQRLATGEARGTPSILLDARGWALTTWRPATGGGRRLASRAPSSSLFRAERAAPDIGDEVVEAPPPGPVVDRSGQVIAVQQRKVRHACGLSTVYELTPRFGRMNGTFSAPRGRWTVFSHTEPPAIALAANPRGLAVVAWLELRRDARGHCVNQQVVRAAVRRPGGRFGAPVTLAVGASSGVGSFAASVDERGEVLVAWRHGQSLQLRIRSRTGRWGATRSVVIGPMDSMTAVLADDGSACLAWTRFVPAGGGENARIVGAAVRSPRGTWSESTLERATWPVRLVDRPERRVVRLVRRGRGAIAAWTHWTGDHLQVLTGSLADGRFGVAGVATPTGDDDALADLAVGPAGRVALAVTANASEVPSGPLVLQGGASGFGSPEPVGALDASVDGAALAYDPASAAPTVVWTQDRTIWASTRGS
jgi:hypothetical protein